MIGRRTATLAGESRDWPWRSPSPGSNPDLEMTGVGGCCAEQWWQSGSRRCAPIRFDAQRILLLLDGRRRSARNMRLGNSRTAPQSPSSPVGPVKLQSARAVRTQRLNEPQADWLGFREERRPEQDETKKKRSSFLQRFQVGSAPRADIYHLSPRRPPSWPRHNTAVLTDAQVIYEALPAQRFTQWPPTRVVARSRRSDWPPARLRLMRCPQSMSRPRQLLPILLFQHPV